MSEISDELIPWQKKFGRNNLPWQGTKNPYLIWVSEIMLQQTQVKTVIPYYQKFIENFPDINTLAMADDDDVMKLWSGLGYYARARNLHESAKIIKSKFRGEFPKKITELVSLPGVGRSSAGAISSFAFNKKTPILDGNVKRVFTRIYGIKDWAGIVSVEKKLWILAEKNLPESKFGKYNQALMDLGATICISQGKVPMPYQKIVKAMKIIDELEVTKRGLYSGAIYFYIFQYKSKFLFIKKPKKGIWGGLWSFSRI